jgi:hypothetical protein
VPAINGDKSQGAKRFHESGHVESLMMDVEDDKGVFGVDDVEKAQDLHTILLVLLEEYLTIWKRGFHWDLFYKGQLEYIEIVLYVHFIKCRT